MPFRIQKDYCQRPSSEEWSNAYQWLAADDISDTSWKRLPS
jgi:hypothetical protein